MPYFRDETDVEYDENEEVIPGRLDDFVYEVPWNADEQGQNSVTVPLFEAGAGPPSSPDGGARVGWLGRLLGRKPAPPEPPAPTPGPKDLSAAFVEELRAAGVVSVYCRMDGGNDEGFAWLDSAQTADGRSLDPAQLAALLLERGAAERLPSPLQAGFGDGSESPGDQLVRQFDWDLADAWAIRLHGDGYGTGEYSMFGAFTVDLVGETITDDPEAAPVVQNITIEGV